MLKEAVASKTEVIRTVWLQCRCLPVDVSAVQKGNYPGTAHVVFTPGRTHSISKSRLAPKRAVLPVSRERERENPIN